MHIIPIQNSLSQITYKKVVKNLPPITGLHGPVKTLPKLFRPTETRSSKSKTILILKSKLFRNEKYVNSR